MVGGTSSEITMAGFVLTISTGLEVPSPIGTGNTQTSFAKALTSLVVAYALASLELWSCLGGLPKDSTPPRRTAHSPSA